METQGPAQGWIDGHAFVFPLRVYYEDTDFSGVVYHANYLKFMERSRSEFLRAIGVRHQGLLTADEPLVWVVRRMRIDYIRPARVDDALLIRTGVIEIGGARMRLDQRVIRGTEELVQAEVEACVVTLDGRPRRVPAEVRARIGAYLAR
jgi:acyl-CoA thioester hydrolase